MSQFLVAEGGEGFTNMEGSCECTQNAIMYSRQSVVVVVVEFPAYWDV